MRFITKPVETGVSGVNTANSALDSWDSFEQTYLLPLKVFSSVADALGEVCIVTF